MPCFDAALASDGPQELIEDQDEEEEDDGLGYYPDGVKRTLTDEQIAMFRASEIYALIRERQVRMENDEAEGKLNGVAETELRAQEGLAHANNMSESHTVAASVSKRKRSSEGTSEHRANMIKSTRRMIRELDCAVEDNEVLDYGDEHATDTSRPSASLNAQGQNGVHGLTVSEGSIGNYPTNVEPAKQKPPGRKIWWPKIEP